MKNKIIYSSLLVLTFAILAIGSSEDTDKKNGSNNSNKKPENTWLSNIDTTKSAQKDRFDFITQLKSNGVVTKIETPTKFPRVYLGESWYDLSFEDKESFMNVVLTYFSIEEKKKIKLILRDSRDNKQIGVVSERGLELHN